MNWTGEVPSFASVSTQRDVLVVGLPDGEGDLLHVATLTNWEIDGVAKHVESVGAVIRQWRQTRRTIRQDHKGAAYSGGGAMMYSSGVMMQGYSGGRTSFRGGGGG